MATTHHIKKEKPHEIKLKWHNVINKFKKFYEQIKF